MSTSLFAARFVVSKVIFCPEIVYKEMFKDAINGLYAKLLEKIKQVLHDITYLNADDIVFEYFSSNNVRTQYLDIQIVNCWFHLECKFKQYMIANILHLLKYTNHQFYNEVEYELLC
jgi:hypothetical protein